MRMLDLAGFRATPLVREPFPYLIVPAFLHPEAQAAVHADYPVVHGPGSFPVSELHYGPTFGRLLELLRGGAFRDAFAEKFDLDLTDRPATITVRGYSGPRDGNIHTDAVSKLLTVLLYLNPSWEGPGGRLRLLRSAHDIEDVIVEVPPTEGTLLAFRRTDNSFHGHKPFFGPRRVLQLNWIASPGKARWEMFRHRVSALVKRFCWQPQPEEIGHAA